MDPAALDALPLPTVLVEGDRVTSANAAFGELVGLPLEAIVGRAWEELVAPPDRARVRERHELRLAGQLVPAEYEARLAGGRGDVPVSLKIGVAGSQTIVQIVDLRGELARRELLGSLARLGASVQRELSDEAVQRRVREGLLELGIRSSWVLAGPDALRIAWAEMGPGPELARLEAAIGAPLAGSTRPANAFTDEVIREGGVFTDDWPREVERWFGLPLAPVLRDLEWDAYHRAVGLRVDVAGAPPQLLFGVGGWLRPEDLPAFRLFASQIAAALEAARTVSALRARNADLDALNRLADAAAYAPGFEAFLARADEIVRSAVGCDGVLVYLVDERRREAVLVHASGAPPSVREACARLPMDTPALVEAFREERPVVRWPGELGPPLDEVLRDAGVGTCVAVPLRFRSGILGLLVVEFRGAPRDAAGCRVELLHGMASHFGAAVETHRLLDDLRRRVAELTLLNDIAVATGELDPVLLLENAIRLVSQTFRAEMAVAYLSQGAELVPAALVGITRAELARAPAVDASVGRSVAARVQPVSGLASEVDDGRQRWFHEELGFEAFVGVPLLAKERVLGSLVLARREARRFEEAEVRLLAAVGVQLGMAVENARLFADTQRRMKDLEAVNSLALRVFATTPGDAPRLLEATCREIAEALDAEAAVILRLDPAGRRLLGVAGWGTPLPPERLAVDLEATPIAAEALRTQEPAWAPEVVLVAPDSGGSRAPPLSLLLVPLTSRAATRGLVAIASRGRRRFDEPEVALAYALASEAAMALENAELYAAERKRVEELSRLNEENARLYEDLRRSYAELARAQEQLIQQERLAALGQLAAVMAHEVRNPLGVIFNSLGTLRRLVQPRGDAEMLFDIVGEEAERLNRIVGDLLDFSRPSTPRLRPEPLDRVLDDAAAAALAGSAGNVELVRDVPADLPPVPMDARLMRQAVLNVAANAVQAMPHGGTLTVSARAEGAVVRVEIADTGPGIPEEVRHRIFEPFFTTRPTGTGLGLAVVKRILDDHRATVTVDCAARGTRFVIRIPLDGVENVPPPWSRSP